MEAEIDGKWKLPLSPIVEASVDVHGSKFTSTHFNGSKFTSISFHGRLHGSISTCMQCNLEIKLILFEIFMEAGEKFYH